MISLLKTARFVFLSLLAGAFLAIGSQSIIPVQDAEAGNEFSAQQHIAADGIVAGIGTPTPMQVR